MRKLGGRCWLVGLAFFVVMAGATLPTPLYPLWRAEFAFSTLMITVIFAVYAVGVLGGLLGLGSLSDKIGRRPVLLGALAASAVSDVMFLVAGDIWMLLAARLVSGLSTGLVTGTATAAMVDRAPPALRARASAAAIVANTAGLASGTAAGGVFAEYLRWPLHLAYVVHLGLLAVAWVVLLVVLEPGSPRAGVRLRPQRLGVPPEVRTPFWRASAAGGAGFAVLGVLNSVAALFLAQLAGVDNLALTGALVGGCFAAIGAGQFAGRVVAAAARLPLACAALIAAETLQAVSLAYGRVDLLLAGALVAGVGIGLAIGHGLASINADCPPARRGEANSTFFAVMYAALCLPVIGAGVLIDRLGLRAGGEIFSAGIAAVAVVVGVAQLLGGHARPVAAALLPTAALPPGDGVVARATDGRELRGASGRG